MGILGRGFAILLLLPGLGLCAMPEPRVFGDTGATRPLVNDFARGELGLAGVSARSVSLETRAIGRVALVEEDRRWSNALLLSARVRITSGLELGVVLPYLDLQEGRSAAIPTDAASAADLIERRERKTGTGDLELRLSHQWTRDGRGAQRAYHVADLRVKPDTANTTRPSDGEIALGSGATDVAVGYRGRFVRGRRAVDVELRGTHRGTGRVLDEFGRITRTDPGDELAGEVLALRDVRPWLTVRGGATAFASEQTLRGGTPLADSHRRALRLTAGATMRASARADVDVKATLPIAQRNVAEGLTYSAGVRWRF